MIHKPASPAPTAIHAPAPVRAADGWRRGPSTETVRIVEMADEEECRLWDEIAASRTR